MIFSNDEVEHARHLVEVMDTLRAHQLKAKFSKCHFGEKGVRFLGHIVSKQGLVVAVQNRKAPTRTIEVRSSISLISQLASLEFRPTLLDQVGTSRKEDPQLSRDHGQVDSRRDGKSPRYS